MKNEERFKTAVAEIANKVRSGDYGCAKCGDLCDCPNADKIIASVADRIEAAHRREVAELRECLKEAVEWSCGNPDEACEDCVAHGGDTPCKCEKWRKALEGANNEDK